MSLRDRLRVAGADAERPGRRAGEWEVAGWESSGFARALRRSVPAATAIAVVVVLGLLYRHLSQTVGVNSDTASLVLQAEDVLHGNVLLHGWYSPTNTFMTTDLLFYVIAVAVRGVSPTVVHDVNTLVYTLLMVVVALLARGSARGPRAWLQMAVGVAVVAAPAVPRGTLILLNGPFHVTTALFILAGVLALDLAPGHLYRAALAVFGLLSVLAVAGDPLALDVGVSAVILVCVLRLLAGGLARWNRDVTVLAVAVAAAAIGSLLRRAIPAAGGVTMLPVPATFAQISALPFHVQLAVEGWLSLFGGNFFGQPVAGPSVIALLRALGCLFVAIAAGAALVRLFRKDRAGERQEADATAAGHDFVTQILLAIVVLDLAAFLFSTAPTDWTGARYLIPGMMAGAALAGRLSWQILPHLRWRAAGGALAIALLAFLPLSLRVPVFPQPETDVVQWLQAHHLDQGLGAYWSANSMSVTSDGRVRVRALVPDSTGHLRPYLWQANRSWYTTGDARFVVIDRGHPYGVTVSNSVGTFGSPARTEQVGRYTVLVWNHNLLPALK